MITNVTASSIKRLYNVGFLRLLSVVLIVYYHFISESYVQGAATPMLTWMKTNSRPIVFLRNAGLFIVSVFLLTPALKKMGKPFFNLPCIN